MSDYRDLVIEELGDSEAELLERIRNIEATLACYRAITLAGIHKLAELTQRQTLLTRRLRRTLDEIRELRGERRNVA